MDGVKEPLAGRVVGGGGGAAEASEHDRLDERAGDAEDLRERDELGLLRGIEAGELVAEEVCVQHPVFVLRFGDLLRNQDEREEGVPEGAVGRGWVCAGEQQQCMQECPLGLGVGWPACDRVAPL